MMKITLAIAAVVATSAIAAPASAQWGGGPYQSPAYASGPYPSPYASGPYQSSSFTYGPPGRYTMSEPSYMWNSYDMPYSYDGWAWLRRSHWKGGIASRDPQ